MVLDKNGSIFDLSTWGTVYLVNYVMMGSKSVIEGGSYV